MCLYRQKYVLTELHIHKKTLYFCLWPLLLCTRQQIEWSKLPDVGLMKRMSYLLWASLSWSFPVSDDAMSATARRDSACVVSVCSVCICFSIRCSFSAHLFTVSRNFTDVSFNLSCVSSSSLNVAASFWLQLSRDIFSWLHRSWNHKNPKC